MVPVARCAASGQPDERAISKKPTAARLPHEAWACMVLARHLPACLRPKRRRAMRTKFHSTVDRRRLFTTRSGHDSLQVPALVLGALGNTSSCPRAPPLSLPQVTAETSLGATHTVQKLVGRAAPSHEGRDVSGHSGPFSGSPISESADREHGRGRT